MTNLLTGSWERAPAGLGFDPAILFDSERGISSILRRIENGGGTPDDLETLLQISDNMSGKTICVLSDACAAPIVSSIQKFREEYLALMPAQLAAV